MWPKHFIPSLNMHCRPVPCPEPCDQPPLPFSQICKMHLVEVLRAVIKQLALPTALFLAEDYGQDETTYDMIALSNELSQVTVGPRMSLPELIQLSAQHFQLDRLLSSFGHAVFHHYRKRVKQLTTDGVRAIGRGLQKLLFRQVGNLRGGDNLLTEKIVQQWMDQSSVSPPFFSGGMRWRQALAVAMLSLASFGRPNTKPDAQPSEYTTERLNQTSVAAIPEPSLSLAYLTHPQLIRDGHLSPPSPVSPRQLAQELKVFDQMNLQEENKRLLQQHYLQQTFAQFVLSDHQCFGRLTVLRQPEKVAPILGGNETRTMIIYRLQNPTLHQPIQEQLRDLVQRKKREFDQQVRVPFPVVLTNDPDQLVEMVQQSFDLYQAHTYYGSNFFHETLDTVDWSLFPEAGRFIVQYQFLTAIDTQQFGALAKRRIREYGQYHKLLDIGHQRTLQKYLQTRFRGLARSCVVNGATFGLSRVIEKVYGSVLPGWVTDVDEFQAMVCVMSGEQCEYVTLNDAFATITQKRLNDYWWELLWTKVLGGTVGITLLWSARALGWSLRRWVGWRVEKPMNDALALELDACRHHLRDLADGQHELEIYVTQRSWTRPTVHPTLYYRVGDRGYKLVSNQQAELIQHFHEWMSTRRLQPTGVTFRGDQVSLSHLQNQVREKRDAQLLLTDR